MLWPEDMPQHALVCLSHNDDLVPSAMVKKHISGARQYHESTDIFPTKVYSHKLGSSSIPDTAGC